MVGVRSVNVLAAMVVVGVLGGMGGMAGVGTERAWGRVVGGAVTMEVRGEVSVVGGEVKLKQVGRWGTGDNAFFAGGLADLVLARFEPGQRTMELELAAVQEVLKGAGVNPGEMMFRGARKVVVTRLDSGTEYAQRPVVVPAKDLTDFLDRAGAPKVEGGEGAGGGGGGGAKAERGTGGDGAAVELPRGAAKTGSVKETGKETGAGGVAEEKVEAELASLTVGAAEEEAKEAESKEGKKGKVAGTTLREALVRDAADRLGLKPEDMEITFDSGDERVLRLAGPMFTWSISNSRTRNLGAMTWGVTIWTEGDKVRSSRRVDISGRARAWQTQVVATRGLASGQLVREEDVEERRVLVDRMAEEMLFTKKQALMMQASRGISAGTVLAGRNLNPVLMVRSGQLVSVVLRQGAVEVKAVARAMEGGAYGQTIRVKNEQTNDVLEVTVSGPQEANMGPETAKKE